ncbi:hypothetical protein LPJ66_008922 [Kickxella alabastrina]|uniref:Uncharacterized protein n=1 Tax=Kickxella alabastrina TaxID=61397 RepID=A0ACC1I775_9FUNG|nr:hypothetical protein LPJ66_008922 [Kickxella alabastrina]
MSDEQSRVFTLEELRKYNGHNDTTPLILLGFNGKVYDVSASPQFYGPGKSYNVFAGRDCTKALAVNTLKEDALPGPNDSPVDTSEFTDAEKLAMNNWEQRLSVKYPVVGVLGAPVVGTLE